MLVKMPGMKEYKDNITRSAVAKGVSSGVIESRYRQTKPQNETESLLETANC